MLLQSHSTAEITRERYLLAPHRPRCDLQPSSIMVLHLARDYGRLPTGRASSQKMHSHRHLDECDELDEGVLFTQRFFHEMNIMNLLR